MALVPDRAPDGPARPLRLFPPAPAPVPPAACDRCEGDCDTLHYDRAGGGELLCGACVRALEIPPGPAPADARPIRLAGHRLLRLRLETK